MITGQAYTYLGDRLTAVELKGRRCVAVLKTNGRCITGRGAMLVLFEGETHPRAIVRRMLRKMPPLTLNPETPEAAA